MRLFIVQQRPLTLGEKALAFEVFADDLNVQNIQIIAHRLILKGYAMSPNGNIYFHPQDYCDDFSLRNIYTQSWLIHELAHIWQLQHGIAVVRKAIFDRRYRYILHAGKSFWQYGIEQQAQMIQDYFLHKKQGKDCTAWEQCIPFLKSTE